jgi:hypothetical protein
MDSAGSDCADQSVACLIPPEHLTRNDARQPRVTESLLI